MSVFGFMRNIPLRAQLLAAFIAPAIIILLSSWAVYSNLEMAIKRSAEVEQTIRGIALREELLRAVLDAETGERGYIITGNPEFLQPYRQSLDEFSRLTAEWRNLAGQPEPPQIAEIETLFSQWVESVAQPVIAARQQAPGRLVSRGFDALYHVNTLAEVLEGASNLSDAQVAADLEELVETMNAAVRSARITAQAEEWAVAAAQVRRMPPLFALAMANEPDLVARERGLALTGELFPMIRDLVHVAVEAEDQAIDIIASGAGKELMDLIRQEVRSSVAEQESRLQELSTASRGQMLFAEWTAIIFPVAGVALGMILLLMMQSGTLKSIAVLRRRAGAIARGELTARMDYDRADELGDLARSFNQMAEELQSSRSVVEMLDGFQAMLVSSETEAEAYTAAKRVCQRLMPRLNGAFHATAASRNLAEIIEEWGNGKLPSTVFHPSECRALRVGRTHCASVDSPEVFCSHLNVEGITSSACIPLMSRDESLGSLTLYLADGESRQITPQELALAQTITDRLALALSNLRLAEKLRAQSIRDPLTGLFNRRYLEETLEREIARITRQNKALSVIALDADHFKRFNDEYGHEAGDLVLKALAEQMRGVVRASDIACRTGGEEFLMVLPEADATIACQRAEDLRKRVEALELGHQGQSLGKVTISLGVATLSSQSMDQQELLRKADSALYQAKRQGRNRVITVPESL